VSEAVKLLALLGPITVATLVSALAARVLVARASLSRAMIAIAVIASLVTVADLLALSHFMLIDPGSGAELAFIALYSVTAGVAAALIVARSNTRALARLVATARALGTDGLDSRVGELRASPELALLARTLDQTAERLAAAIEAEREVEAQRRDLMTSISHDLRTPLASMRAMVEAVNDGVVSDPETVRRYAGEMHRSTMALVAMVDDLFELAQADAASFAADRRQLVPLAEIVDLSLDVWTPEAARRGIRLSVDLGEAGRCLCSPRLGRVVHSLVDNAIRYTPAGGRVTVRAESGPEGIRVAVEDTGAGIAADHLARIFEPFWRADPARSGRGAGLGLTLAKRIVEGLGGEIRATSTPERGSRFDVSLPTGA
jgi:signal transduction histidine kinase